MESALRNKDMDTNREEVAKTEETKEVEIVNTETERETDEKVKVEEFKISGDVLVAKIKELIRQGNIRRIILKNESGQTLIEIPMTAPFGLKSKVRSQKSKVIYSARSLVSSLLVQEEKINILKKERLRESLINRFSILFL